MDTGYNVYVERLTELIQQKEFGQALDYLETIPAAERNYWEILNLTGILCSYCQEYDSAISFFRKALQKYPDLTDIYYNLADAYLNKGEYQQADVMLTACMQLLDDEEMLAELKEVKEQIAKECEKKTNSVLMIAYYYPPLSGSGVFRSLKFSKYLPEMHWKPTVISTDVPPTEWNFSDESMLEEIPKGVDVIRIADMITSGRDTGLSAQEVNELVRYLFYVMAKDKEAIDLMSAYLKDESKLPKLMSFPCSCLKWSWKVIQYIEQNMNLNDFDVIYTTSGPASAHLVGYYLKKKYGIPWVADYRDPWTGNAYGTYDYRIPMHKLLYKMERIMLQTADSNITYAETEIENYIERFQIARNKLETITNGYDESDFGEQLFTRQKNDKFTITYSGLLYTQQRTIRPILHAIKALVEEGIIEKDKLCFRVVGTGNEQENQKLVSEYLLTEIFEQTGYVSHQEALKANVDADLLLLFVGDEDKFKPTYTGKIFEQLRSGRTILAIAPKDGEADKVLKKTGHGEAFLSTQLTEIKRMVAGEYQKWAEAENKDYHNSSYIKVFERKYLTAKLAAVFNCIKDEKERTDVLIVGGGGTESQSCIMKLKENKVSFRICDMFLEKKDTKLPTFSLEEIKNYRYRCIVITSKTNPEFIKEILIQDYEVSADKILNFWHIYESMIPRMVADRIMLNQKCKEYDGVILGLSHTEAGIVANRMPGSFCNLATSGQDLFSQLETIKYCMEKYPEKIKNLKYVIIDLYDYNYFNYDTSVSNGAITYLVLGGPSIHPHNFDKNKNFDYSFENVMRSLEMQRKENISNQQMECWESLFSDVCKDTGYEGYEPRYDLSKRLRMVTDEEIDRYEYSRAVVRTIFEETIEENKKTFEELLEFLYTINPDIKICTVIIPKYIEVERRDEKELSKHKEYYYAIVDEFQKKYGFKHIDLKECSDLSYHRNYYFDAAHLNYYGACRATDIISKLFFENKQ